MTSGMRGRQLWGIIGLGLAVAPLCRCAAFQAYGTHTYFAGTCENGRTVRLTHDFHRDAVNAGSEGNYAELWLWTGERGQAERSNRVGRVAGRFSEDPRVVLGHITGYADGECMRIWLVEDGTQRVVCAADLANSSVHGLADTKPAWADPKGGTARRLRETEDSPTGPTRP